MRISLIVAVVMIMSSNQAILIKSKTETANQAQFFLIDDLFMWLAGLLGFGSKEEAKPEPVAPKKQEEAKPV